MDIQDLLSPACTRAAVQGASKKRILEIISDIAAEHLEPHEAQSVLPCLLNREKMGSTGIGNGIAMPHGHLSTLTRPLAILITSDQSVDFDAIDKKPVDIFFAMLVPEGNCQQHLQTLSAVASKLSDKNRLKQLRNASNDQALYEAINA